MRGTPVREVYPSEQDEMQQPDASENCRPCGFYPHFSSSSGRAAGGAGAGSWPKEPCKARLPQRSLFQHFSPVRGFDSKQTPAGECTWLPTPLFPTPFAHVKDQPKLHAQA